MHVDRYCTTTDFSIRNQRKRFSDWKKMVYGLDQQLVQHGGLCMQGRECRHASVEQWSKQFRCAFSVQLTLCKYLHPSRKKRVYLRKRPESALLWKVSTVLSDMRKITRTITFVKGLIAIMCMGMIYREKSRCENCGRKLCTCVHP